MTEPRHGGTERVQDTISLAAVTLAILAIMIVDFFVLPTHFLVAALYAIPILIASHRFPPRWVALVTALVIVLDVLGAYIKRVPLSVWPYGTLALLAVGYLAATLSSTIRKLNEAHESLQAFVGMAAHDLRSPLATVLGYAQALARRQQGGTAEGEQKAILAIEHAASRMRRLTDDLLDAARIGAGSFELHPDVMDLGAVAEQVVETQQATTTKHHIVLAIPERIEGSWDRDRIAQLLTNLVSNAIKYSPNGCEVRLVAQRRATEVLISLSDQGIGIARENMGLLFQPFSRLYREQAVKGTGLGLYICWAIATSHGGRIWAESELGKGSVFHVALPLDRKR